MKLIMSGINRELLYLASWTARTMHVVIWTSKNYNDYCFGMPNLRASSKQQLVLTGRATVKLGYRDRIKSNWWESMNLPDLTRPVRYTQAPRFHTSNTDHLRRTSVQNKVHRAGKDRGRVDIGA